MKKHASRSGASNSAAESAASGGSSAQALLGNAAIQDIQSGGKPLPQGLLAKMEASFGADFSAVRVHESPAAEQAGALAFAEGTDLVFQPGAYDPDSKEGEELIAHELAHVVQQGGQDSVGPQFKGAVDANPSLEAEADAMGARAAAGQDAPVRQTATAGSVQRYEARPRATQRDEWQAGVDLRISDDGKMATGEDGGYGSHAFWTLPAMIVASNRVLEANQSVIRLHDSGDTLRGQAPDGSGERTLVSVEAENVATGTQGDDMQLWADCGRSFRDVVGVGRGTGGNHTDTAAVYNERRVEERPAKKLSGWRRFLVAIGLAEAPETKQVEVVEEAETRGFNPANMKAEIFAKGFGGGQAEYARQSEQDRDAWDEERGINRYAAPEVGEGYTMSTGGNNFPGVSTWNFHWAGVVMVSGGDRVVLENYAVGDPEAKNSDWEFHMYGPPSKPGQTFHDQHLATKQHGDAPTTMRARRRS